MNPTCFVIMGFGKKTDFTTGRMLDLDKSYKNIIKPAITAAGYDCIRADEVLHSGVIDVPMYEMLYAADLVVADLSTSNLNAVFELGVRHALKPRATIIIAEEQFKDPFDVNHIVIRPYVHLGTDIGFDETMRMRQDLQTLAAALETSQAVDSPVYTVLSDLQQPKRKAVEGTEALPAAAQSKAADKATYAAKFEIAIEAKNTGDFDFARKVFRQIYEEQTGPGPDGKPKAPRPRVTQELALATYKAGEKAAETGGPDVALAAYAEATELLQQLGPETTTDPETLGLWSAIHKHRAEMPTRSESKRRADLDIAISAAERGFVIRRDYYNGTNLAYLLNLRASLSSGNEQIADNVLADRVRRQVVDISAKRLETLEAETAEPGAPGSLEEEKYWTAASHAESLIALGDKSGPDLLQESISRAPAKWMADVTLKQLDKLQALLGKMQHKQ